MTLYPPYYPPQPQRAPQRPTNVNTWLLIVVIVIGAFFVIQNVDLPFEFRWKDRGDQQEQNDRRTTPIDPIDVTGATLIFVSEKQDKTVEQELVLRELGTFIQENNLDGFRHYDEEVEGAQPYLQLHNSPLVALVKNQRIVKTAPFPNSMEELKKFISSR